MRALVFTDVVESTRWVERLGDARSSEIWTTHDRRARDLIARHHGREIGRADGFFVLFDEPADAARYALDYHKALAGLGLSARIGLHVGPVTLRENIPEDIARGAVGIEVEGLATPITARVMALARGGQTLLTAPARAALAGALDNRTRIESHGHYRLKGVEEPIEVFELGVDDSASFVPPGDVEKAYRVVRTGDFWLPVREVRHNLPAERDAFVGRTAELRAFASRLDAGTRLITVLGPGGTGKTRFVRRYGRAWLGDWPGGVYFCDLSEARSLDGIFFAVASSLGVPLGKEDPAVQLGHAIAGRGRTLVILDNFEQVVRHAQDTLSRWLDRAPDASFVATSRERLHLPGEEIFAVEPLPLDVEAIELFAARARAQKPDFVLNDSNRASVAEVVRLLDGLPLAIELAAARVRVLSPAQIVERMRDRFGLLAGARGAAARQDTLRAAIDWSWDLLTPWEKAAFAQCSMFEGGFTIDAAEAVLDLADWSEAPPAMDVVQALADKSLLRTWVPSEQRRYDIEETYFGMYMSIHEYAAEKLDASGQTARQAAELRHGRYFAGFGTDEAIAALYLHGGTKRRRELALELDNLVAACVRANSRGDAGQAVATFLAIWEVLDLQGPCALGIDLGARVLAMEMLDASQRAEVLQGLGAALRRGGQSQESAAQFEQAHTLARSVGDKRREALILMNFGNLRRDQGRIEDARAHLEAALVISGEVGDRRLEGNLIGNLGILHGVQGRPVEARAYFEQALAIHREVGNRRIEGIDTGNLGSAYMEDGTPELASTHFHRAIAIHREVGNRRDEGVSICNLGILAREQGRLDEARERCTEALAIVREVGDRLFEGVVLGELATVLRDQGRTDEARTHLDHALAIHRAVGNRRSEGIVLGSLGELLVEEGRIEDARESYRRAEALLGEVGDALQRVHLLCDWARAEAAVHDIGAARAVVAAAEQVAAAMNTRPDSDVRQRIATVHAMLR